jgi:hypothetical protein
LGTGPLGVLTACWVRAEPDDRMRLNNWSIAVSYDTARILRPACLGAQAACGKAGQAAVISLGTESGPTFTWTVSRHPEL